jgi:RHS repeat-associated protein
MKTAFARPSAWGAPKTRPFSFIFHAFLRWCLCALAILACPADGYAAGNDALFVSQSVPTTMRAGQTYNVSITVQNTGASTWSSAEGYKLGAQNPEDNATWGPFNRVELARPVAPNEQYTFTFPVTAPAAGARRNFQWKMVREFVEWFGAPSANVSIGVDPAGDGARFVSQTVPVTMDSGKSYNVAVTVENTGTTTWTTAEGYKLGAQNPQDNTTWGAANRVELDTAVAPGEQHTFKFSVTAPGTGRTSPFQWRMVREFVGWFGDPSRNFYVTVFGPNGDATTFFHNDAAGSPLLATDSGGRIVWKESYRPYGERLSDASVNSEASNSIWFAGRPHDETTGLSYMGARYYDPLLARFVGVDPAEVDPNDVHSFNRYSYANNNPYKFVDPDGHSPIDVAFLVYDLGKLGVAMYTGVGVVPALLDVGMSTIGVGSPIPFAGQALKAARAAERGVEALRGADKAMEVARTAEHTAEAAVKKVHGNSLSSTKPAEGYTLIERNTGEVVKYGETTMGTKRYTKKYLEENNVQMQFEAAGTKREMHTWQHEKILEFKENHGAGPLLNKSEY